MRPLNPMYPIDCGSNGIQADGRAAVSGHLQPALVLQLPHLGAELKEGLAGSLEYIYIYICICIYIYTYIHIYIYMPGPSKYQLQHEKCCNPNDGW